MPFLTFSSLQSMLMFGIQNQDLIDRGHSVHARMVVRFTITYAISAYQHWYCEFKSSSGEVYSIQHYIVFGKVLIKHTLWNHENNSLTRNSWIWNIWIPTRVNITDILQLEQLWRDLSYKWRREIYFSSLKQ
jgi:hypothetical protein